MQNTYPISAVLYGLEDEVAEQLAATLATCCRRVEKANTGSTAGTRVRAADVIFCRAEADQVRRLKIANPNSSIIVASRLPEVSDWLDALEAGAEDYCAAPFEGVQVRWVLETHVRAANAAA